MAEEELEGVSPVVEHDEEEVVEESVVEVEETEDEVEAETDEVEADTPTIV